MCYHPPRMIRFSVLASSSKGNATVVSAGQTHILVDAGISAMRIRKGLEECGLSYAQLSGIFITHEHTDHICGLGVLGKRGGMHLYCSRYLSRDLRGAVPSAVFTYLEPGATVEVGELKVTPFSTSHDALDPLGYVFEHGGKRLGYITDTGRIMRGVPELMAGVDALYLESNYDEQMLANSGRPLALQNRISGNWGHLSNEQAADFVRSIAHPGLQHIVLAHISPECNTPELAYAAMRRTLDELQLPAQLACAPMANRLDWREIV